MDSRKTPCTWCNDAGYFGDFAPGIYPMPCPHCGGTGLEGILSEESSKKISTMRKEFYEAIGKETERWRVASEGLRSSLLAMCSETTQEREIHALNAMTYHRRLNDFPLSYLPIEERCLQESWKKVKELIDPPYHPIITENSRQVLGKSYIQNARAELARAAMQRSPVSN